MISLLFSLPFPPNEPPVARDVPPVEAGEFGALEASQEWTRPSDPLVLKKLEEWQDRKLGILLHWGTYSQWGIVESWSLVTTRHPWNNRPAPYANLDDRAYMKVVEELATTFNPVRFDPDKWARAFEDAGVKYVFSMTKHHDGFCMWDTKQTEYKITAPFVPFHSDPRADTVKRMTEAFRKRGLSSGLYFSKADWHSPHYWLPELGPGSGQGPNYEPSQHPDEWQKFKEFTWRQVEELMTGYGRQDVLWLDGGAVRPPNAAIDMDGLAAMARKHQPGLLVVDRTVGGANENYVTPEGSIPDHYLPYPWETCMPMGTSWPWRPNDDFKSVGTLVRNLCRIVARGGNYLIGIGPDGSGEFDPVVYERLKGLGEWMRSNGEAIYATRPLAPYEDGPCVFTRAKDGTIYALVLAGNDTEGLPESVVLPKEIASRVSRAELVGKGPLRLGADGRLVFPSGIRDDSRGGSAWAVRLTPKD
ncbi:MAG: alpha-L-fucosidase [Fimbriimonadaceae bacterium]|nr:alpha-L-fucosidase [Fimbriimonadaceae bacterium]